jgi:hypothetical protein
VRVEQLTKTKAEKEKEARLALEKELEVLREKIRMTDIQTLSSLNRYSFGGDQPPPSDVRDTTNSVHGMQCAGQGAGAWRLESEHDAASVGRRHHSLVVARQPRSRREDLRPEEGTSSSCTPPPSLCPDRSESCTMFRNHYSSYNNYYYALQGDEIDAKLAEVANSKGLEVPFVWVKEGMYKFGGKARPSPYPFELS